LGTFPLEIYFKEDAIKYAWDFLTVELGLPKDRLFVSIYFDDEEAFGIWHNIIGLPAEKNFKKGRKKTTSGLWGIQVPVDHVQRYI